jgi:two-component system, NtrC family, nitrogen regulation sensor histidine kinase GlnL
MSIDPRLTLKTEGSPFPEAALLIDAIPNPILALDETNRVRFANAAAEDFFQVGKVALLRSALDDLVPFSSPALSAIAEARRSGGTVNEHAISAGTPRFGGERSVDLQATLIHESPRFVIVMLLERSMAHKIDRQLTHQGAARSVSGLAAMLAHEIKNPLAGIRGAAQLVEPTLSAEDRALARLICDETDRIRDLVDQMEVFSDERPPERKPVNIHAVLEHVKAVIVAGLSRPILIREDYDPSLPPVAGSRDQLVQVFMNLVKNAVEAIENDGEGGGEILLSTAFRPGVRLTIAASGERVTLPLEVRVRDTGPGVPDDMRPHIFEPFVTSKVGGKGVGLALVAKIVHDHGGIIECEPNDRGTTFRVLLPTIKEARVSAGEGEAAS